MRWCCFERAGHRVVLCGHFNVSVDFHPGAALVLGIPLGTLLYLLFVVLRPSVLNQLSYGCVLFFTCIMLFTAVISEVAFALLFFGDPGFTTDSDDPTALLCPVCQLYVHGFDHHCNILGVCIGERNMRFFVVFLSFISVHLTLLFTFGLIAVIPLLDEAFSSSLSLLDFLSKIARFVLVQNVKLLLDMRCMTFVALLLLLHGAIFSTMMSVLYWFYIFTGRHSLERRRRPCIKDSAWSVFRDMHSTELAGRVLSRIALENP